MLKVHELSVATSLMNIIVESAKADGALRVLKVNLVVGNMAGIVADSLKDCFDTVKEGSIADKAELVIEEVKATALCVECGGKFEVEQNMFNCPKCGEVVLPSGGDDLYIKNMEVE